MTIQGLSTRACLWLLLASCPLVAAVEHLAPFDNIPSPVASYTIVDLGETDIELTRLSKAAKKLTLAPSLNNDGIIIGNTSKGGFVTLPGGWCFAPQYDGMVINFHSINTKGDLLVAVQRGHESVEWMRWPCKDGGDYGTNREHIKTVDPFVSKFYVAGFNDESTMIAYAPGSDSAFRPLTWDSCQGLTRLGVFQDLDIKGTARGISKNGTVVGVFDTTSDQTPYVWNPYCGLLTANNYRQYLDPTGWVEFADLLITEDSTVYGTYWVKHLAETYVVRGHYYETRQSNGSYYQYNAFTWKPASGQVEMADLQGMRLTAVNKDHVLVGSLLNSAALRLPGKEPLTLESLVEPSEVKDWKLLEITDINDRGQVVGYGWYQDKMHLFLANPLR